MSETSVLDDVLPLVGEDPGNRTLWLGLGAIGLGGLLLFAVLEGSRQSIAEPQVASPSDYAAASAPRAELAIPQPTELYTPGRLPTNGRSLPGTLRDEAVQRLSPVRLNRTPPLSDSTLPPQSVTAPNYLPQSNTQPLTPDQGRSAPVIVHDTAQAAVATTAPSGASATQATKAFAVGGGDRTHLVAQGTLISAVLETAIDSTQSGQVRAMISSNVYNALGSQVLIPKGSRIFGEYKGELGAGQNRAQIIWTRLIRPDGATISLDSPASDQLGRAGIKGSVNSHFGERLLNALLQSSIDFGVLAASRAVTSSNGVIVALPSSASSAGSQIIQPPPKPTLRVRHGKRISVFVARDLDFSAVE